MKRTLLILALAAMSLSLSAQTTIFYESFDLNDDPEMGNTGGNDDTWEGDIANSQALITDNDDWNLSDASGAFKCAKLGTSRRAGYAITPPIYCTGSVKLSFKAAAWSNDPDSVLTLNIRGGTTDKYSFPIPHNRWGEYSITITDISEKITIKFASLEKRFFLDEVRVTLPDPDEASIYVPTGNMVDFGLAGRQNSGGSKTISVVGMNLAGNITASIEEDASHVFSLPEAQLPAEGGSLAINWQLQPLVITQHG